ncbi:carbon starvation protein [Synergistales bacterium]|nr:carbon starvation protein [Synergistales bacterium]
MNTFIIGLVILIVGGAIYGKICANVFGPDDRKTPAFTKADGVDFVEMPTWRNTLINLLNIAGTGPVLGPIQGILFGPIAFILIPVGCVLGGAMHDYFSGMMAMRNEGAQMPALVKKYSGKTVNGIYQVFVCLLMLLVGAVFTTTPGDLAATEVFRFIGVTDPKAWEWGSTVIWGIYAVIFAYYIIAVLFPIDAIIGKIYPIFGFILLLSAVGLFIGLFTGHYPLTELSWENWKGVHPSGLHLIPIFFITVACGIVSGFHSTQTAIISRTVGHEKQGSMTFYYTMILEGFIAMVWAAAAMGALNKGIAAGGATPTPAPAVVSVVAYDMLGTIGGILAILGVIVLPITSGDTALRSLRLMVADAVGYDQKPMSNRLMLSIVIFALTFGILYWSKTDANGFSILWRYFAWSNQMIAIFAFAIIAIYLYGRGYTTAPYMSLLPGMWYAFITSSFICNANIGFGLPMDTAYGIGAVFALVYAFLIYKTGKALNASRLAGALIEPEPKH